MSALKLRTAFITLGLALLPGLAQAGIEGYWLKISNDLRNAVIEIYADGDTVSGRIVDLEYPVFIAGERSPEGEVVPDELVGTPKRDVLNVDSSLHERPIEGLQHMSGFRATGRNEWSEGSLYNPEDGKTYRGRLRLRDSGRSLEVRGYIGTPMFGRTQTWTRIDSPADAPWAAAKAQAAAEAEARADAADAADEADAADDTNTNQDLEAQP